MSQRIFTKRGRFGLGPAWAAWKWDGKGMILWSITYESAIVSEIGHRTIEFVGDDFGIDFAQNS